VGSVRQGPDVQKNGVLRGTRLVAARARATRRVPRPNGRVCTSPSVSLTLSTLV